MDDDNTGHTCRITQVIGHDFQSEVGECAFSDQGVTGLADQIDIVVKHDRFGITGFGDGHMVRARDEADVGGEVAELDIRQGRLGTLVNVNIDIWRVGGRMDNAYFADRFGGCTNRRNRGSRHCCRSGRGGSSSAGVIAKRRNSQNQCQSTNGTDPEKPGNLLHNLKLLHFAFGVQATPM